MENPVYSPQVIEFVTVASESVSFFEKSASFEKKDYLTRLSKLLAIIYQKTSMLPDFEPVYDEDLEQFVTESDYEFVHQGILSLLGDSDSFAEYSDTDNPWSEMPELEASSISENIADIYQDLKDFLMRYQMGNEDIMNDALHLCQRSFREYWGEKLLSALKAIHHTLYCTADSDEDDRQPQSENSFLHRRMSDYQEENDNEWN